MKNLLLAILTLGTVFAYGTNENADAAVQVLSCEQITQAKSSYHIRVDLLNSGPHSEAFRGSLFFNVESTPRVVFTECKGAAKEKLSCTDETKTWFLLTYKKGSNHQFTVAQVLRKNPEKPGSIEFICE